MSHGDNTTVEGCPICLNEMNAADLAHPIQCPASCNFNFCVKCLLAFLASSKDDYEMASDGNRHVKIHLNCPNCRADISGSIEDTIRSRQKALSEDLQQVPDCELSAKELRLKHWSEKEEKGIPLEDEGKSKQREAKTREIDPTLFGGLDFAMTEQEQKYVTQLMTSGYVDQLCQAAQILSGISELIRKGKSPVIQNATNNTAAINRNNSGRPLNSAAVDTARATAALQTASSNTVMRHGYSNAGVRTNRSAERRRETNVSSLQKQLEEKAREKLRRPLPARMPLCVSLSTGEFEKMALLSRQQQSELLEPAVDEGPMFWLRGLLGKGAERMRGGATMTFVDDEWDGSVADAFARARIGRKVGHGNQVVVQARVGPKNPMEQISVKKILAMGEEEDGVDRRETPPPTRTQRVLVGSVRGQAGKSGIMRGDVVTHVNGEVFTGDASELNAQLVNAFEEQGHDGVVMVVVNAEECTAEALRLRARVS